MYKKGDRVCLRCFKPIFDTDRPNKKYCCVLCRKRANDRIWYRRQRVKHRKFLNGESDEKPSECYMNKISRRKVATKDRCMRCNGIWKGKTKLCRICREKDTEYKKYGTVISNTHNRKPINKERHLKHGAD